MNARALSIPILFSLVLASRGSSQDARAGGADLPAIQRVVAEVMRADYRADVEALARCCEELSVWAEDPVLGDAVRYWRGFARSCSALSRVFVANSARAPALDELRESIEDLLSVREGELVEEAQSLASGCLLNLAYLLGAEDPEAPALMSESRTLMEEASRAAPDSPRVLWILGGQLLSTPPERGGGRARALETYERGLAGMRAATTEKRGPLAPRWGEAELLMSLAFAHMSAAPPDLERAEALAREALELEPEWKYVRDVLLPGILEKTRAKEAGGGARSQ
jgi:hypothetical protein